MMVQKDMCQDEETKDEMEDYPAEGEKNEKLFRRKKSNGWKEDVNILLKCV